LRQVCRRGRRCGCDGPHVYAGLRRAQALPSREEGRFAQFALNRPLPPLPVERHGDSRPACSRRTPQLDASPGPSGKSVQFCTAGMSHSCCSAGSGVPRLLANPGAKGDGLRPGAVDCPWQARVRSKASNSYHFRARNPGTELASQQYVTTITIWCTNEKVRCST
jgi:hypothetical protein